MHNPKILIPMIQKVMPTVIASQIAGVQPMTNSAGSIFKRNIMVGGHTFNQRYWPYVKMVSWDSIWRAERFCYDNFKSRNWRNQGQHFAFKRHEDAALFMLRWS